MILSCPYPDCSISIEIAEINCAIFRCGICKDTNDTSYEVFDNSFHKWI